ncbi:hypothetical protein [Kitasatospora sp. NPDC101183]|uniref:hypothetical protein n=1 Tax=Kitasatospora sp. NPDC101183 TaxID=3364100 RepID=UPI00381D50DC
MTTDPTRAGPRAHQKLDATEPIAGWITARNLRAFLELLSHYAGYAFDATDWDTVELGLHDTDDENPDAWYAYPLVGANATLEARLARAVGAEVISVSIAGAEEYDLRLRADTLLAAFACT